MIEAILHYASFWTYLFLGLTILSFLAWGAILILYFTGVLHKNNAEDGEQPNVKRQIINHPVIGYKTANIDSITLDENEAIVDILFQGLVGKKYAVKDTTYNYGYKKFNMYNNVDKALEHSQNWGCALLEVVGFGDVEEHELGFTAQNQRVLQVGFLECSQMYTSEIKCRNEAEFLACDDESDAANLIGYKTYCAGCVKRKVDAKRLFPYFNKSFTIGSGKDESSVVVMGQSSREKVNFFSTILDTDRADNDTDNKGK